MATSGLTPNGSWPRELPAWEPSTMLCVFARFEFLAFWAFQLLKQLHQATTTTRMAKTETPTAMPAMHADAQPPPEGELGATVSGEDGKRLGDPADGVTVGVAGGDKTVRSLTPITVICSPPVAPLYAAASAGIRGGFASIVLSFARVSMEAGDRSWKSTFSEPRVMETISTSTGSTFSRLPMSDSRANCNSALCSGLLRRFSKAEPPICTEALAVMPPLGVDGTNEAG